jgi:ABC-type transport system involved in multi-copper enzyme maturation permease subunit
MTFLPLVTLELRTAARRKSTYRIRRWTAVIAFVVGLFFIAVGFAGGREAGKDLFGFLTTYAVCLALMAGLFLTADCISEEKREGTLGLLFLTDLKGYDIVLGKFIARSLNAVYGLLALLPIAGISLLLGGLSGGEFWRTALALINVLFISLATGIFVSGLVRQTRAATTATLILTILLFAGMPISTWIFSRAHLPDWLSYPAYVSPYYAFSWADDLLYRSHRATYWQSLAASHLFGWFLLGFTSWMLPRAWQEKPVLAEKGSILSRFLQKGRGTTAQRAKTRQRLLPLNPIAWLIGDEPLLRRLVWGIVAIWGTLITILSWQVGNEAVLVAPIYGTKVFGFVLKILVATQVCRFFIESRKSGALELLLCTPLRNRDIIRGQWLALRRIFLWPLIILALFNLMPLIFIVGRAIAGPGLVEALGPIAGALGALLITLWFTAGLFADVFTIGWVGMWLALSAKKPDLAPVWTILFVLILPAIGVFCGFDLLVDMFLIIWASSNLQTDFRWTLSRQYRLPPGQLTPQIALPYVPPPPVIAR